MPDKKTLTVNNKKTGQSMKITYDASHGELSDADIEEAWHAKFGDDGAAGAVPAAPTPTNPTPKNVPFSAAPTVQNAERLGLTPAGDPRAGLRSDPNAIPLAPGVSSAPGLPQFSGNPDGFLRTLKPGVDGLSHVSRSGVNFVQGYTASALDDYDNSAAGQNPSMNPFVNLGAILTAPGDTSKAVRAGGRAIWKDNGDEQIGKRVPDLAPNTLGGGIYNTAVDIGGDPLNFLTPGLGSAVTKDSIAAHLAEAMKIEGKDGAKPAATLADATGLGKVAGEIANATRPEIEAADLSKWGGIDKQGLASRFPPGETPLPDGPQFMYKGQLPDGSVGNIYKLGTSADGSTLVAYGDENLPRVMQGEGEIAKPARDTTSVYKSVAAAQGRNPPTVTAPKPTVPPGSAQSGAIPEYAQRLQDAGFSPIHDFDSLRSTIKQAAPHLSDEVAHNTALLVESLRKGSAEQLGTDPARWYQENLPTIIKGTQERAEQVAAEFNERLQARGAKADAEPDQFRGVYTNAPADYPLATEDAKKIVTLLPTATESTAPHEIGGHVFLEMIEREASKNNAVAARDLATIKNFYKTETLAEAQEKFSYSFERWLKDGVAPNESLKGVFTRFSAWLKNLYESTATVFNGEKETIDNLEATPFDEKMRETVSRYYGDVSQSIKRGSENATSFQNSNTGRNPIYEQGTGGRLAGEAGGGAVRPDAGTTGGGSLAGGGIGEAGGQLAQPVTETQPPPTGTGTRGVSPYEIEPEEGSPLYQWYRGLRTPWSSSKLPDARLDSAFETVRAAMLQEDPNVDKVERNFAKIPYTSPLDGKEHNYFPDFLITAKDGRRYVEEVKPLDKITDAVVKAKAEAAQQYYGDRNIDYHFVTENDLPAKRIADARTAIKAGAAQKEDGSANFQRIVGGKPAPTAPPPAPSVVDNLVTGYKAGLLSWLPTHEKNIIGNGSMQLSEEAARAPAALADIARVAAAHAAGGEDTALGRVLGTGRTTAGLDLAAVGKASREAVIRGMPEAWEMIRTGKIENNRFAPPLDIQKDLGVSREFATKNPILNAAVNSIFRGLSASDHVFKTYGFRRAIEEQATLVSMAEAKAAAEAGTPLAASAIKARRVELTEQPTNAMVAMALEDAEITTFNNSNRLGEAYKGFRNKIGGKDFKTGQMKHPLKAASLDVLVGTFVGTPSNVLNRTVDYALGSLIAPITAGAKIGTDLKAEKAGAQIIDRAFDDAAKREFAKTFGRGVTGASLIATGYALASSGQLTGYDANSSDRQKRTKAKEQAVSLKVGGTWYRIDSLNPAGSMLLLGATMREQGVKRPDFEGAVNTAGAAITGATGNAPLVGGLPAYSDTQEGKLGQVLGNQAASFIPSGVRGTAQLIDGGKARDTSGSMLDPVKGSIPFLRGTLPEKKLLGKLLPPRNVLNPLSPMHGDKSKPDLFKSPFKKRN